VPKEWQIACWLTDTLTSLQLYKPSKGSLEIYQRLVNSMFIFYDEARAPNVLNSCLLKLLARLVIKLRYLVS
jgi:hypothetical protein